MWKKPRTVLVGVATVIVLVFVLQNDGAAGIQFLFWQLSVPLFLLMFALLAVGFAGGWFLHVWHVKRRVE